MPNRAVVFSFRPFCNIRKYRNNQWDLEQSGKLDSFRHILKSSGSMVESSGSQFFRTTTGIQSEPDAADEAMFVMIFLTILGVTKMLYSFRLVLEGKGIPKSSRKGFSKQICFIRCRRQHLGAAE